MSNCIKLELKFGTNVKRYWFNMQRTPEYQDVYLMVSGHDSYASHLRGLTDEQFHDQIDLTARQLFPIPHTRNSRTLMHIALAEFRRRNPDESFDTYCVDFDGGDR